MDLQEFYNTYKESIKCIYQVGSSTLPYIRNPHDVDTVAIVTNNFSKLSQIVFDNKLKIRIKAYDDLRDRQTVYVFLIHYAQLLYGEPREEWKQNILDDKEYYYQVTRTEAERILHNANLYKRWYYVYNMLCILENDSYELTAEQIEHINNLHDQIGDNEAIDYCIDKLELREDA